MSSYVLIHRDDIGMVIQNLEALKTELTILLENSQDIYDANEKLSEIIHELEDSNLKPVYIHPSNRPPIIKQWQKGVIEDINFCLQSFDKALSSNFIETLFPDAS